METDHIQGGAFQIARKLFESDLWENKPSSWKVIWIYILGNVNHKENEHFNRGEGFFNFSKDLRKIGNDITEDMVKKFCSYARINQMISTERSTRGMRIKVLNYNTYQTMGNYIRTSISTSQARAKHEPSTPINKNVRKKEDKTSANAETISSHDWRIEEDTARPRRTEPLPKPHEFLEVWNKYQTWESLGKKGTPPNPSAKQGLLPIAKSTTTLTGALVRARNKYSTEEFEQAVKNYVQEVLNRPKDDKGYYQHRYSLYEFLVHKDVLNRYANR